MRKTRIVEWDGDERYRFTLKTVTVAGDMRRSDLLAEGHAWFTERRGVEVQDAIDAYRAALQEGDVPEEARRRFAELWMITDWASIVASLDRVETQQGREGAQSWKQIDDGHLYSYEAFAEAIPQELFVLLADAAHEVNPHLWRIAADDEAKKNEKTSAG